MSHQSAVPGLVTLRIIWGGIFSSTVLFLVVLSIVERPGELAEPMMLPVMGLVAASTAVVAVVLPELLFRQGLNAQKPNIAIQEQPDPEAPEGFGRTVLLPSDPAAARRSLLAAYSTKTILGCALSEAVCIFGFVLGFLGVAIPLVVPFFLVGWLLLGYHFPRDAGMLGPAKKILGISRL